MNKPFFSIAIPTYEMSGKGVEFLNFSLSKLNKQTFKEFEVVVSDHSVNNDIKDLCYSWGEKLNIRYFKNSYKIGASSPNINHAISNAKGLWIKILFQDDFLFDDYSLDTLKQEIESNSDRQWFVTGCEHTNDGNIMYRPFYPKWAENIHLGNNTISSPSVLTIKNNPNKLYFDEDLVWLMDVEYYKRMSENFGQPIYVHKILVVNRTWDNSVSNTLSQKRKEHEETLIFKRYA